MSYTEGLHVSEFSPAPPTPRPHTRANVHKNQISYQSGCEMEQPLNEEHYGKPVLEDP